jgi:Cu/Ag efflux pump CusA
LKGVISLSPEGDALAVLCRKLTPWSSALLTGIWFALVAVGTVGALISLFIEGEMVALGGVVLAFGIVGLGLVFLVSGAITVVFAYRLENARLTTVYQELREVLEGASPDYS